MKKYQIGSAEIDFTRGEIKREGDTQTLEPKVMSVLELLIKANGEVVSQETIFSEVWPGAIYSQSLIQRSIALIRKALGDSAKTQTFIVTHPKRGYSLVIRDASHIPLDSVDGKDKSKPLTTGSVITICLIVFFIFVVIIFSETGDNELTPINIVERQKLSATDASEFAPQMFQQKYLSFIRRENGKGDAIWLSDVDNEKETRLTQYFKKIAAYQWLDDGRLIFAEVNQQGVVFRQTPVIHHDEALTLEQEPSASNFYEMSEVSRLRHFQLTEKGTLLALITRHGQNQFLTVDIESQRETVLVQQNVGFNPYSMSVSHDEQRVALVGFTEDLTSNVMLWQAEPEQLSLITELDSNIYDISWLASDELLLTEGRKFQQLDLTGQINELPFTSSGLMSDPFVSEYNDALLITEQITDADLWRMPLHGDQPAIEINSTDSDYAGQYSPDGSQLVFISTRKGFPQIYVKDNKSGQSRVVYNNPERKMQLAQPKWHPTKAMLLTSVNEQMLIIDLTHEVIGLTQFQETSVYPLEWYHQSDAVLVMDLSNNQSRLSKFDLSTHRKTLLYKGPFDGALLNEQEQAIVVLGDALYQLQHNELTPLLSLDQQLVAYVRTPMGMYLHVVEQKQQGLLFLPWGENTAIKVKALPSNAYVLWDVNLVTNQILFESNHSNRELLLLKLK